MPRCRRWSRRYWCWPTRCASPPFRAFYPAAGDDFKVMGRRVVNQIGMTVALAFIDCYMANGEAYRQVKQAVAK